MFCRFFVTVGSIGIEMIRYQMVIWQIADVR